MKNKQISSGILLSFLGQFISIAVGLAYAPIMIRILGQNEYGLYQLVQSTVNYLNLMNFGFTGAYIRYYSLAKRENDPRKIADINGMFFNIFMIIAGAIIAGGAVLYCNIGILGDKLTAQDYVTAKALLVVMVVNLAVSMPNSLFVAYMSANERFVFQKAINIIMNLMIPLLNLPLLLMGYGSLGLVWATLALTVLRLAINVFYCVRKLRIKVHIRFFDKAIFWDLLGFTFFIFISDLVDQLNTNVDKLLLGRMTGTIAVSLYSVAFTLKTHYNTITWIVPEMYIPEVNRLALTENADRPLTDIFIKIGRFNNYIVLLVLTGFALCGREFIRLWVGAEYDVSYYATMILLLVGYIPAVQTLGVNIQNAKNLHQIRSVVYLVIAIANIMISVLLIPSYGVIGACVGTLIATFLGTGVFMNIYYHKKVGLNVFRFWKEILKSVPYCIVCMALGAVYLYFFPITGWGSLIVFIVGYVIVYAAALFILGLKKNERAAILKKIGVRYGTDEV